ncbi:hypothetical protein [Plasmodium yoelii yoelii]|uniref:Uncharacterized protein n=1 Tax=Plasmodium yoelii yoelii TaxID=73239 RepID=Q7RF14_PLAYO|nr:hypothetical protein [Plasmodium yoelii yoelii]
MNSLRQRQILRGHVDSINCVNFHPFFKTLTSASADKTVILPPLRINHIFIILIGYKFRIYNIFFNIGPSSANKCPMDKNNKYLFIASEDNTIKIFDVIEKKFVRTLKHEFPIKNIIVENNKLIYSLSNGDIFVRGHRTE